MTLFFDLLWVPLGQSFPVIDMEFQFTSFTAHFLRNETTVLRLATCSAYVHLFIFIDVKRDNVG